MGAKGRAHCAQGRGIRRALWLTSTAVALVMGPNAYAQGAPGETPVSEAQVEFNIPAQPLTDALAAFGQQSGMQVSATSALVQGKQSPGVTGAMPPESALLQLLDGTGITYTLSASNTAMLKAAPSAGDAYMLPPITVYGEKVERSYLDTYTSVGIVTAEDLEDYNIGDTADAFDRMGNVRWFQDGGNSGFMIRGLNADGVTQPSNSASLISVVVDGVTQSPEGLKRGSRGLWDVEQMEVLRGPQSSLQGRNALAGAVIVKTKDPTYEPEALARVIYGSSDRKEAAFAVSGPIIEDQLAVRLAGETRRMTSDIEFTDSVNEPLGEDEYNNFRGKVLIEPEAADGLKVLLTAARTYDAPTAAPVSDPFFDRVLTSPGLTTEFREMTLYNYAADMSYEFDSGVILRSVSAYNDTDLEVKSAPSSAPLFVRDEHRKDGDFTQELRLELGEETDGLSGVAGAFYGNFSQETDTFISGFDPVGGIFVTVQDGTFLNETETMAAYFDARYRFMERLSLIAGLRYQHDEVRNKADIASTFGPTISDRSTEFDVFLPTAGLAFDIDDEQTLTATARRGYRQGFTQVLVGTPDTVVEVEPEFVWTYELAYRFESPENRLTLGANIFYNDYTDQQIDIPDPVLAPLSNTRNAGESESYGAEIEGRYDFGNGLNAFGSLGVVKTELNDFEDASCAGGSCSGNEYPEAPEITASLGGVYRHSTGFFGSASASYTDTYFTDVDNSAALRIEDRVLVDTKLGFEAEHFSVALYCNNLFDEDYITSIDSTGMRASIGDARTVGIELTGRF